MWFKNNNCNSLRIKEYERMMDKKPIQEKLIVDKVVISELIRLIESLPIQGNMSKKWSEEAPMLALEFYCDSLDQGIWFFRTSIQTPDTSFFSPSLENENRAYKLVRSLMVK
ncbi:MAG: hypothetical protein K2Q18_01875 [Bdellovibrionales bacterium]|nr:hypothetical protein [Bdellovibrionales bacterium]